MCRSICRRAERSVVPLVERDEVDSAVQRYLNRLSDFFYVASRWSVEFDKVEEIPWVPHKQFWFVCWTQKKFDLNHERRFLEPGVL